MRYTTVMTAEMDPDCYDGPKFDAIVPRWKCSTLGDKGDTDHEAVLKLAAKHFPPGTKIAIQEPQCPKCGDLRMPASGVSHRRATRYAAKCDCGFDWHDWVLCRYS